MVQEVVDSSTDHMITSKEAMLFEPGTGNTPETFLLKDELRALTNADWNKLTGDPGYVDIEYSKYGHDPGVIRLSLEKSGEAAEYGQHNTSDNHDEVEEYVLTAQYIPFSDQEMQQKDSDGGAYHTTPGQSPGEVIRDGKPCVNKHIIELFVKALSITKTDASFRNGLPGAEFTFYHPATAAEKALNDGKIKKFPGDANDYYPDEGVLAVDNDGIVYINNIRAYGSVTKYYLLETKEPEGYIKLETPIPFELTLTDNWTEIKPNSGLYNREESALLQVTELSNIIIRTNGSYDPDDESTDLTNDPVVSSPEYEVIYYRIKNEASTVNIVIHKVNDKNVALPGATFKIMNGQTVVPIASSGTGVIVEPKVSGETVNISENTFTIPSGGVAVKNLSTSETEYEIVEVSAPTGYVIEHNTPVKFKVTGGTLADKTMTAGVDYRSTDNDFIIPNNPGAALPNTGGSGTNLIYLFGIMLTGLAGAGLVMRKRRRNAA